jgi:hypothetical protein
MTGCLNGLPFSVPSVVGWTTVYALPGPALPFGEDAVNGPLIE